MPIYSRWEKSKPLPTRVTDQPTMEDRIPALKEIFEEMTVLKPATDPADTKSYYGSTLLRRRPNPQGILKVMIRVAKKLKASLD